MPELRRGRIHNRWVLVAPDREHRPSSPAAPAERAADADDCPFCPGREDRTPPEIARVDGPSGAWRIRVVSNKYAAFAPCAERSTTDDAPLAASARSFDGSEQACLPGCGAHEIVIETPEHDRRLAELPVDHVRCVIDVLAARMSALLEDPSHRYVMVYKNQGVAAGASLSHAHSQIVAVPIVPPDVAEVVRTAETFHAREGRCLFCDVLDEELSDGRRMVEEDDGFAVFAPYGGRFPYELTIYPKAHEHDFSRLHATGRQALAETVKRTLRRLTATLGDVACNLVLQSVPNVQAPEARESLAAAYHWRIEIVPRLTRLAGLELGSGTYVNTVPPESAARRLRDAPI